MKHATTSDALRICEFLEGIAPAYGAHVALTGGCLYKDIGSPRKDIDIMFYRIRQTPKIDIAGLLRCLVDNGFTLCDHKGWVQKSVFDGFSVDLFFPEDYPYTGDNFGRGPY